VTEDLEDMKEWPQKTQRVWFWEVVWGEGCLERLKRMVDVGR
jgi:hypothetical protein